jgi:protein-S-isoprenylcysteine O-methyltransferase Ste14
MTIEELQLRRLAVSASGLIYWGGVMIQARRVRKQIGRSPNLKPKGAREKALWVGWFVVILIWIGQPWLIQATATQPPLAMPPGLLNPVSLVAGLALVVLGYAGTLWTYAIMGSAWRIGINAKEKNQLVSRGPFGLVRHPLYMLQVVMLAGAALLLPTAISLAGLVLHYVCTMIKAKDEEKYLTTVHGDAYRNYVAQTGRLFPRLMGRRAAPTAASSSSIDS